MSKTKTVKTEQAIVERVGFRPNDRMTVVYVVCQGESMGKKTRMDVDSGEYTIFDNEFTRTLVGKELTYSYEAVNDMREPVGVKFVEFVGEN